MLDLRPLRSARFRQLATSLWVNEAGNAIGEVALAILVYDRTGSPIASAGLFLTLRVLPALLAPLLTSYVESMRLRIVLPTIYVLEAVLFAAVAGVSHHFSLPVVLVLVATDGLLAIVSAALLRSALTNDLMAGGLLREGNGLINLGTMVAFAAAPVIAGMVIAHAGIAAALNGDAVSFAVTALIVATTRGMSIESDREASPTDRVKAALSVVRNRPALRRLLIAVTATIGISSVAVPVEVVFAETTLHAGSSGYGLLLTCWGLGMIVGAGTFALGRDVPLMRLLGLSTALVAIGYGGLALSPTLAAACAFSFVGGTGNGAAWVAAMTAVQEQIPLNAQSAVMSIFYGLTQVVPGVGFVVGGVVTAIGSPRIAYAISAIGTALALAVFLLRPVDQVQLATAEPLDADRDDAPQVPAQGAHGSQEISQMRRTDATRRAAI